MPRHKDGLILIGAAALFLFVSRPVCGQLTRATAADSGDAEDEKATPIASLTITPSETGRAQVNFYITAVEPSTRSENRAAVENALGCNLQLDPRFSRVSTVMYGSCNLPLFTVDFHREGRIRVAPLAEYAKAKKIERLVVMISLPDTDTFDSQPAPASSAFGELKRSSKALQRKLDRNRVYSWQLDSSVPETITFSFGYSESSVHRAALVLTLVLAVPLLFVYWLGRKALSAPDSDKAAVWFSYMRYLQWSLTGALIAWWIASESIHLVPLLKFFSTGWLAAAWDFPVTGILVDWIPPCLVWILCFALSHPVQEKLRGLKWTRRELLLQGVYSVCAALIPLAMFLTGLQTLGSNLQKGLLWFVGAIFVRLVAAGALQRLMGTVPQSLTTGDLRDHAFGMAQRLGVKLQQVYVVPAGKGQMANAFARTGNTIAFTDFLLQRMSRPEVNYILGHELTHLKLKHPGKIAGARVASMFGAFFVVGMAAPFGLESPVLRYGIILAVVTLFPLFWSRRFEYAADAGAVELTGDPRSAISALFKLSSLNMMPLHWTKWSEKWLTHPSSLRRAQAIARKAGIPIEQIPEIAGATVAQSDHYILPATIAPGAKVLSTQTKQKTTIRATMAMLQALILVPIAFAWLARFYSKDPVLHRTFYLVGPIAAIAAYFVFANFAPLSGLRELIVALKAKLLKEGVQANAWGGVTVGFAPAPSPRIYENNTNWDIGSFFIRSDRLCYCGEETKFALRRDQIAAIVLGSGIPGLLTNRRIYIAWKDAELNRSGTFNIGCIEGSSILEIRRKTAQLERILQNWWKASADVRPLPPQLAELTSPLIGAVTSVAPSANWRFGRILKELWLTGVIAAVVAVLCGLPFHLLAYLFSVPASRMGSALAVHSPGAGWYVVCVAVVLRALALIPFLRYKDKPFVAAPTLEVLEPTAANSSPTAPKSETGGVLTH